MDNASNDPDKVSLRSDVLAALNERLMRHLTAPGTWWDGSQRRAIAEAARAARGCRLCADRKAALSASMVDGVHDGPDELDTALTDVIHRVVTDPGRLTKRWYAGVIATGALSPETYVELVAVTVLMNALDVFARAVGAEPSELAPARSGEPSRIGPSSAVVDQAWVPQIPAGIDGGAEWTDLYGDRSYVSQIERALSLVPAEVEVLDEVTRALYMDFCHVPDPSYAAPDRALDRPQTELVAARVSAINECFY